jgi:dTDP-4-amino-4,6-dideoxygalactose transaminase
VSEVRVPLLDLQAQRERLGGEIEQGIERVLRHGQFVLGPEVRELEESLEQFCGARHAISCANGTDALILVLMSEDIGVGDAVVIPDFTFVATVEAVVLRGATPIFVDVDSETFSIDAADLASAESYATSVGLVLRAVIAVDLFGRPAVSESLLNFVSERDLLLITDAAQSFGGSRGRNRVGNFGDYTTTSFFPSKPLGCFGDGGAIFTNDENRAGRLRALRAHGSMKEKYQNELVGLNSRLDTLQAAVLLAKLKHLNWEISRRNEIAAQYSRSLEGYVMTPQMESEVCSAWAQYTIRVCTPLSRDNLKRELERFGISSAVYYPIPLHLQPAYRKYDVTSIDLSTSSLLAKDVLSLPLYPDLSNDQVSYVIDSVKRAITALS